MFFYCSKSIRIIRAMNESLREAASLGNLDAVRKLLQNGACINSQNGINGWTALHWACKRGHVITVRYLLRSGADISIETHKGELPVNVTQSDEIRQILNKGLEICSNKTENSILDFRPSYLQHPVFPYSEVTVSTLPADPPCSSDATPSLASKLDTLSINSSTPPVSSPHEHPETANLLQTTESLNSSCISSSPQSASLQTTTYSSSLSPTSMSAPMLVKVRVADSGENDFIEVELPALSYAALLNACCEEMEIQPSEIAKIRKLPNICVRKDKDVQRMKDGQELEVVLNACTMSHSQVVK